jgi:hypothetical protein
MVAAMAARRTAGRSVSLLFGGAALSVLAQTACFRGLKATGTVLYLFAGIGIVAAWTVARPGDPIRAPVEIPKRPTATEWGFLAVVILLACVFHFYALNQLFNYFEGELSVYAAASTSLFGMLQANRGAWGPWAPLGLLYYLPIGLSMTLCGSTLLAIRISSAAVGVLTVPLIYLLLRRVGGPFCAVVGTSLYGLSHDADERLFCSSPSVGVPGPL